MHTNQDLTVVVPTFNRRRELIRALESLVAQSNLDFEVIVCDDGSTEDITSATDRFKHRLCLRLLRIENSGGPARPRNVATQAASTTWISYLDSDDWWFPERMERLQAALTGDVDIVYHPLTVCRADADAQAKPAHGARIGEPLRTADPLLHMVRFGNPFPTSGTTVRRELILNIGGFDEDRELVSVEDFDAWLRMATNGARVRHLPEVLGAYWVGADQISTFNARQFERQRHLFERQLERLPPHYRTRAKSNFSYLLGSYALDLGMQEADAYFREVRLSVEPLRWLKAQIKRWRAPEFD